MLYRIEWYSNHMAKPVNSRSYDNSGREAAARATRRAVTGAARELFLEKGYVATTLAEIARVAGVSVQTVYAQFGNKQAIVKQVLDEAIAGDDEPVPINERPEVAVQIAEKDPQVRIRMHARFVAERMRRVEPVDRVLRSAAAADPAVREQLEQEEAGKLAGMREMAELYGGRDQLAVPVEVAAQRVAALMSPELYRRTVLAHGWSQEQYAEWLGDLLAASILEPAVTPAVKAALKPAGKAAVRRR
ncbi:MAG: ttgR 2 [Frankiales bacterium]|nr:ttgR 2 [Frankiales bacterium]